MDGHGGGGGGGDGAAARASDAGAPGAPDAPDARDAARDAAAAPEAYAPDGRREWSELLRRALEAAPPPRTAVAQLATVRAPDGGAGDDGDGGGDGGGAARPAVRCVNVREVRRDALLFCTDARSRKVRDAAHCARAELLFWLPHAHLQLRLAGRLRALRDAPLRARWWAALRPHERLWFAWPPPAAPRDRAALAAARPPPRAPDCFLVMHLLVDAADVSHLRRMPYARELHTRLPDGTWRIAPVNP